VIAEHSVPDRASDNFNFSAAAASFGMLLRDSAFKGASTYQNVLKLAKASKGKDNEGYRAEFIRLVEMAEMLHNTN
jgi:Ca-activated chloride channel family protein